MPLFRLLHGMHEENDAQGKARVYKQGETLESKDNLLALNGPAGMSAKFEQIQQLYGPNTAPQPFTPQQQQPLIDMSDSALLDEMRKRGLLPISDTKPITVDTVKTPAPPVPVKYPSIAGKPAPKTRADLVKLLTAMTAKELQQVVEDEEFDIPPEAKSKDDIVKSLLAQFDS